MAIPDLLTVALSKLHRAKLVTHRAQLHMPNVFRVLGDRAVARELAGSGNVQNGFARPSRFTAVRLAQALMRLCVTGEVS